ncbi:MAG TPA: RIP metalloprotease RseP [bacterium]|nr:RIP metalloprotease RseP [bacterium]
MDILEVVLAFVFMITIHEYGHYLAMRWSGVEVTEFAIGFGPTLLSRKWKNTTWAIRAIPLGGFCLPQGGDLSGKSAEEMAAVAPVPGDFLYASWWKRVIIAFAGPLMNFVSAVVLLFLLFSIKGEIIPYEKPYVGFVPPGSLAEKAGLKTGDHLLKVNGKDITNLALALDDLMPDYGQSSLVTVERGGKTFETNIVRAPKVLNSWEASNNWFLVTLNSIGIGPDPVDEASLGIMEAVPPVIGMAALGQPARNAGLREGDTITAINGQKLDDWGMVTYLIRNTKNDPIHIEFLRDGKTHSLDVKRVYNGSFKAVGIGPVESKNSETKKLSLLEAGGDSVQSAVRFCKMYMAGFMKIVVGKVSLRESVAGPVTIVRMMYKQASQGLEEFVNVVVMISLILFLSNLIIPISLLDGGQILLFLVEGIKRKPVSIKAQIIYQNTGVVLIVCLVILVFFNDFKSLFLEMHNNIH